MSAHHHTTYVFKLRRSIVLESDLLLARLELEAFLTPVEDIPTLADLKWTMWDLAPTLAFSAYARVSGQQGYRARAPLALLPELIRCLSFVQTIYCETAATLQARAALRDIRATFGPVVTYQVYQGRLFIVAVPHYALMELADVVTRRAKKTADVKDDLQAMFDALLGATVDKQALKLAETALSAQSNTAHLSHDIHYYKAKFFPRMARAMLNISAQFLGGNSLRVLDNFAGSGTTLLESALLGMDSTGLDIDPLSVLIARAKLDVLKLDSQQVDHEVNLALGRLHDLTRGQLNLFDPIPPDDLPPVVFPDWLLKNRKMTPEIAAMLSGEIAVVRRVVQSCDPALRDLFRVLMSDAIAHRVRMRFLGTGVGRFSLTFSKKSLPDIFGKSLTHYARVIAACEWLRETLHLQFADSVVLQADTRQLPDSIDDFDVLLTSPPYLPASSGRESYAKARAPSLVALGMADGAEVDLLVDSAIGSMDAGLSDLAALTEAECDLVAWLQQDELRAIKAEPTARYFLDMRQSFAEMYRVLRPGGLAVVVSGKQSTFYTFSTRDVLYTALTAQMLAEEAYLAGFTVEALYDLPLKKSNKNARPRSLDDYYETLIVLQKPPG